MKKEAVAVKHTTVNINNILSWVSYINPIDNESEYVIVFIPGFPGVIEFYDRFLEEIYKRCQIPVFGLSYAGHKLKKLHSAIASRAYGEFYKDSKSSSNYVFNLEDQIQHKLDFIIQYIDSNKKVILLAHSVGSYITLNIMERMKTTNRLAHVVLIFPVFERTMETEEGQQSVGKFKRLLKLKLMLVVGRMPKPVTKSIVSNLIVKKLNVNDGDNLFFETTILSRLDRNTIHSVYQTAVDLSKIGILDNLKDVIKENTKKITFYYGGNDGWTPNHFIDDMRKIFPSADIQKDTNNIAHTFMILQSVKMADIIANIVVKRNVIFKKNDVVCRKKHSQSWHVEITPTHFCPKGR